MKKLLTTISLLALLIPSVASASLTTNLVSYWKLDESSGNAADSVGSNTLTNNNTATYASGKINNGVNLVAASSQSLSISHAASSGLEPSTLTVNAWAKITTVPGSAPIFAKSYNSAGTSPYQSYQVFVQPAGGKLYVEGTFGGSAMGFEGVAAPTSATGWFMITLTYDGTTVKLYYNGSLDSSGAFGAPTYSDGSFWIGRYRDAVNTYWDGMVDEVGFWNRALSAAEVTSLYNSGAGLQYPFTVAATPKSILQLVWAYFF